MPVRAIQWQTQTREALAALATEGAVVVVPIGSVEQHGPHLPVDTDSHTVEAVALRAAAAAPFPVVVAPCVWWGVSEYWMPFGGTIALAPQTLENLLWDVCMSIARDGFLRVMILNGHAGNVGVMHNVTVRLASRGIRAAGASYWSFAEDVMRRESTTDGGRIGHAGEIETSLQLALRPQLVAALADPPSGSPARSLLPPAFAGVALMPPDPSLESPSGIYGDPSSASAELGERILETSASRLVDFLAVFRGLPLPIKEGTQVD